MDMHEADVVSGVTKLDEEALRERARLVTRVSRAMDKLTNPELFMVAAVAESFRKGEVVA